MVFDRYQTARGIMISASQPDWKVRARLIGSFEGRTEPAYIIAPLPDGAHVVMTTHGDTDVAVWRIEDQSLVRVLTPMQHGTITNVEFDPNGAWMAVGVENVGIYMYPSDIISEASAPVGFLPASSLGSWFSVAFMGKSLFVTSRSDGTIQEWGGLPDTPRLISTWTPPTPPPQQYVSTITEFLAVDPPRERLVCQLPYAPSGNWRHENETQAVTILRRSGAGTQFDTEMALDWVTGSPCVALSPRGDWLAVAEYTGGESAYPVRLIHIASGAEHSFFPPDGLVSVLRFSPDGRYLAVGGVNGEIQIHSASDWHVHVRFVAHPYGWDWRGGPPNFALIALAWTPDSRYLFTAGGSGSTYDVKTGWNTGPADYSVKVWEITWYDRMAQRRKQPPAE